MTSARPPLSPRLEQIRRAISRNGDYSGLRDGGEALVRAYAQTIGLTAAELMWEWNGQRSAPPTARKTTVDVGRDGDVTVVVDDDPPVDRQTEPDDKPDEDEADDYSDDDVRDDPPSKPKPGGKSSGDQCPDDADECEDD